MLGGSAGYAPDRARLAHGCGEIGSWLVEGQTEQAVLPVVVVLLQAASSPGGLAGYVDMALFFWAYDDMPKPCHCLLGRSW